MAAYNLSHLIPGFQFRAPNQWPCNPRAGAIKITVQEQDNTKTLFVPVLSDYMGVIFAHGAPRESEGEAYVVATGWASKVADGSPEGVALANARYMNDVPARHALDLIGPRKIFRGPSTVSRASAKKKKPTATPVKVNAKKGK